MGGDNIFVDRKRDHISFDGLLSCPTVTLVDIPKEAADRKIPAKVEKGQKRESTVREMKK